MRRRRQFWNCAVDNNRIGQLLSTAQFYGKILKKIFLRRCGAWKMCAGQQPGRIFALPAFAVERLPEKKGGDGKIRALIKGWNCAANNNPAGRRDGLGPQRMDGKLCLR